MSFWDNRFGIANLLARACVVALGNAVCPLQLLAWLLWQRSHAPAVLRENYCCAMARRGNCGAGSRIRRPRRPLRRPRRRSRVFEGQRRRVRGEPPFLRCLCRRRSAEPVACVSIVGFVWRGAIRALYVSAGQQTLWSTVFRGEKKCCACGEHLEEAVGKRFAGEGFEGRVCVAGL